MENLQKLQKNDFKNKFVFMMKFEKLICKYEKSVHIFKRNLARSKKVC